MSITIKPAVDLRVLSLGAGVQSSALALMIKHGEIPEVDCAIFSDTMGEPEEVYKWLDWLKKQLPFPVYIISYRNLKQDILDAVEGKYKFLKIPVYTKNVKTGKIGLLRRQCTTDYKILPIIKKVRELLGYKRYKNVKKGTKVEMLMGISFDEAIRMKTNQLPYIENMYPLVDKKITREDCFQWMKNNNYPTPPRSACTFCPYHSNTEWLRVKENKKEWEEVVAMDKAIRKGTSRNIDNEIFLHRDCVPLDDADLEYKQSDLFEDHGQLNNCDGMCGV
tara:strand:- start:37 stop:870 length:834 start_codon:yes stop_codon:yes gene_type:complete